MYRLQKLLVKRNLVFRVDEQAFLDQVLYLGSYHNTVDDLARSFVDDGKAVIDEVLL